MKYYLTPTHFSIGDSFSLQVAEELTGNTAQKYKYAYEAQVITGYNIYNVYFFPIDHRLLMCAEVGLTPIMYETLLKYQYYSDYLQYAEKPWPRFVNAYKRGVIGDFTLPSLYPVYDVEKNDGSLCWALTQVLEWDLVSQPDFNSIYNFLSYAVKLKEELANNDVSKSDKFKIILSETLKGVEDGINIYRELESIFPIEL